MVPGKRINEISEVIEKIIRSAGYRPIINLTGHGLDCWDLHARTEVPNVKNDNKYELKAGDVFAIEPFVTDGNGRVIESGRVLIYRWISDAPTRFREGRRILMMARDRWHGLPFTKRWAGITPLRLSMILRDLTHSGALYEYPVLREQARGIIAQAEHTVIVGEKPEVITK
jgi:methionyl aminopeptidase